MSRAGTLYVEKDSVIHKLDGSIKFLAFILWTIGIFAFMDIRVFIGFLAVGCILLKISKLKFKEIKPLFMFVLVFTLFNAVILILITPEYGTKLAGSRTELLSIFGLHITAQTLWFILTLSLKYLSILPLTLIFIFTTHPSKFASSLNRIGVSYKIAYAINISLRYIPDIKEEFITIKHAQEARGVAFDKGDASISKRLSNYKTILLPLIFSSLDRIDVVSNAMSLRGFGKHKKRTWFNFKKFDKIDCFAILTMVLGIILVFIIHTKIKNFYYPFK